MSILWEYLNDMEFGREHSILEPENALVDGGDEPIIEIPSKSKARLARQRELRHRMIDDNQTSFTLSARPPLEHGEPAD